MTPVISRKVLLASTVAIALFASANTSHAVTVKAHSISPAGETSNPVKLLGKSTVTVASNENDYYGAKAVYAYGKVGSSLVTTITVTGNAVPGVPVYLDPTDTTDLPRGKYSGTLTVTATIKRRGADGNLIAAGEPTSDSISTAFQVKGKRRFSTDEMQVLHEEDLVEEDQDGEQATLEENPVITGTVLTGPGGEEIPVVEENPDAEDAG